MSSTYGGQHPCRPLSTWLAIVRAIKDSLGLPDDVVGALPIVGAANAVMGIVLLEALA